MFPPISSITTIEISRQPSRSFFFFSHPHRLLGFVTLPLLFASHLLPAFASLQYQHHHHHRHRGYATDALLPHVSGDRTDAEEPPIEANFDANFDANDLVDDDDAIFSTTGSQGAHILVRLRGGNRDDDDDGYDDDNDDGNDDDSSSTLSLKGVFVPGGAVETAEGTIVDAAVHFGDYDDDVDGDDNGAGEDDGDGAKGAGDDSGVRDDYGDGDGNGARNGDGNGARDGDGPGDGNGTRVGDGERDGDGDGTRVGNGAGVVDGNGARGGDGEDSYDMVLAGSSLDADDPSKKSSEEANDREKDWIALLTLPKEFVTKSRGTRFLSGVQRAMMLGASAVLVLASIHPQRLFHRISGSSASSPVSLFERPVVILRAAEFNVSLLVQALANKLKARASISPRAKAAEASSSSTSSSSSFPRLEAAAAAAASEKSKEQTTPPVSGGGGGGGGGSVTFWGRCGRYSEWHGVVCLDEQIETTAAAAATSSSSSQCVAETCSDSSDRPSSPSRSSGGGGRGGGVGRESGGSERGSASVNGAFHLWNLLYSGSISLCLFLLLKMIGSSASLTMMMTTMTRRRGGGDDDDELLLPPIEGEKDVEISLRRLARDALRAMPIRRFRTKRSGDCEPRMCPICLSNFTWNQKIRLLPCLHEFHTRCADPWLVEHRTCPLCKLNIVRHWALKQI